MVFRVYLVFIAWGSHWNASSRSVGSSFCSSPNAKHPEMDMEYRRNVITSWIKEWKNEFMQVLKWLHWKFVFKHRLFCFFLCCFHSLDCLFPVGTRWLPAERELLFLNRTSKRLTDQLRSYGHPSASEHGQGGAVAQVNHSVWGWEDISWADLTRTLAKIIRA